jgi:hypothetical protein
MLSLKVGGGSVHRSNIASGGNNVSANRAINPRADVTWATTPTMIARMTHDVASVILMYWSGMAGSVYLDGGRALF